MRDILMMKTARTIVDTCAGVKKGEKVVIVTDPETMDVAQVLMGVLYEREIELQFTPQPNRLRSCGNKKIS